MSNILLVNITWNPYGWRNNNYINPKAGHQYAKENVGGEALNFHFNKKSVDTDKYVHGFVQWTNSPTSFEKDGLIIFYTRNTDIHKGQIVGVYGNAETFHEPEKRKVTFQKNLYWTNIKGERNLSLLFPISLDANNYKEVISERMVGRIGFTYKDEAFAERILFDELTALNDAGISGNDFDKLVNVYEYYIGKKFKKRFVSKDEKEQKELELFYKRTKTKEEIRNDLKNLKPTDPEEVVVHHKSYKRDNKTIAQLKILRDFKCQICNTFILKKNGSKYVEAAHIEAKHKKGRETPDNIILVCPNHHKEFDYGDLKIKKHTADIFEFDLNKKSYS